MDDRDALVQRAYHEAGHAVAAAMRGFGHFDEAVLSVRANAGSGIDWGAAPGPALPFVAYAGPWAQARARWAELGCAGEDEGGRRFEEHVADEVLRCPRDAMAVALAEYDIATLLRDGGADENECWRWVRGVLFAWRGDLEDMWPVVDAVARDLLGGAAVPIAAVRAATDDRLAALYC